MNMKLQTISKEVQDPPPINTLYIRAPNHQSLTYDVRGTVFCDVAPVVHDDGVVPTWRVNRSRSRVSLSLLLSLCFSP